MARLSRGRKTPDALLWPKALYWQSIRAGKSKAQILAATTSALQNKEIPVLAPRAMCYMMAKQQYLGDDGMAWHPHLMFSVSGDAVKSWGAIFTALR
jgi:hypothetical protein